MKDLEQVADDMFQFIIAVSKSDGCGEKVDGYQSHPDSFKDLFNAISPFDQGLYDGGYKLYFGKYVEYLHEKGKTSYNLNQFIAPPRKDYNVPHSDEEKAFVKECGSFRSGKETVFSFIESKFQIFDHTNSKIYIQSKVLWNTMYSLCCLLYNINKFSHHSFWRNEDFEFPSNESELEFFLI